MNKQEQIEEMENISRMDCDDIKKVLGITRCSDLDCQDCFARLFYAKGYRKQSEVAREIFAEIEYYASIILDEYGFHEFFKIHCDKIAELKKKYGVTDDGNF